MNISIDSHLSMDTVIWRYIDISKLLDLLVTHELHFSRPDEFKDPFDSSFIPFVKNQYEAIDDQIARKKMLDDIQEQETFYRNRVYLNCWNESLVESAALWDIYMGRGQGVALKSTVGSLKCAIAGGLTDGQRIRIDPVEYGHAAVFERLAIANPLEGVPNTPALINNCNVVLTKSRSYDHEKEIRAWIEDTEKSKPYKYSDSKTGIRVSVNIKSLIRGIYVHPETPVWFSETIRSVVKKFIPEYSFDIIKSELYSLDKEI